MLERKDPEVNASDNLDATKFTDVLDGSRRGSSLTGQSEIKKLYIFMNCFAISLGFMQFGIGMASFSNSQNAFQVLWGWTDN